MFRISIMAMLLGFGFVACKPIARQPVSDFHAVTDGNLALGAVPVESDDGEAQAYRLLVCKKSMTYPKWMLEDNSRCRSALLTGDGDEVVLLPDHLQRDFAAKYEGYAKAAAIPVALVLVASGGVMARSAWIDVAKKTGGIVGGLESGLRGAVGSTGSAIDQTVRGGATWVDTHIPVKWVSGHEFVRTPIEKFWEFVSWVGKKPFEIWGDLARRVRGIDLRVTTVTFDKQILAGTLKKGKTSARVEAHGILKKSVDYNAATGELNFLRKVKRDIRNMTDTQVGDYLKKVDNDADDYGKKHFKNNNEIAKYADEGDKGQHTVVDKIVGDSKDKLSDGQVKTVMDYHSKLMHYRKYKYNKDMAGQSTGGLQEWVDKSIETLQGDEAGSMEAVKNAYFAAKGTRQYGLNGGSINNQKVNTAAVGGILASVGILATMDQSIWGHADRQVSKHWSQIFHAGNSFQDNTPVTDLRGILNTLADDFGFVVNEKAFRL